MTQEQKEILLKDLCARLPYGVKISPKEKDTGEYDRKSGTNYIYPDVIDVEVFIPDGDDTRIEYGDRIVYLDNIQLYLRPLSSMTEEERKGLTEKGIYIDDDFDICQDAYEGRNISLKYVVSEYTDWLNEHHFDYRGLISMGLALEASEGMYKTV